MSRVINANGEILVTLGAAGGQVVSAPATLTSADIGMYIFVDVAGTVTLPSLTVAPAFIATTFKSLADGPVVLAAAGVEKIDDDASVTIAYAYSSLTLVSDGNQWRKV